MSRAKLYYQEGVTKLGFEYPKIRIIHSDGYVEYINDFKNIFRQSCFYRSFFKTNKDAVRAAKKYDSLCYLTKAKFIGYL